MTETLATNEPMEPPDPLSLLRGDLNFELLTDFEKFPLVRNGEFTKRRGWNRATALVWQSSRSEPHPTLRQQPPHRSA